MDLARQPKLGNLISRVLVLIMKRCAVLVSGEPSNWTKVTIYIQCKRSGSLQDVLCALWSEVESQDTYGGFLGFNVGDWGVLSEICNQHLAQTLM